MLPLSNGSLTGFPWSLVRAISKWTCWRAMWNWCGIFTGKTLLKCSISNQITHLSFTLAHIAMESIACELVTPYVGQELTRIWNWKTAGWPVPTTATWPSFGRKHSLKWMFKISSPRASKYQVWRPRGHQVSPTPVYHWTCLKFWLLVGEPCMT